MNKISQKIKEFITERELKTSICAEWLGLKKSSFYHYMSMSGKRSRCGFTEDHYIRLIINYKRCLITHLSLIKKEKPISFEESTKEKFKYICFFYGISQKKACFLANINYVWLRNPRKKHFFRGELNILLMKLKNIFENDLAFIKKELDDYSFS